MFNVYINTGYFEVSAKDREKIKGLNIAESISNYFFNNHLGKRATAYKSEQILEQLKTINSHPVYIYESKEFIKDKALIEYYIKKLLQLNPDTEEATASQYTKNTLEGNFSTFKTKADPKTCGINFSIKYPSTFSSKGRNKKGTLIRKLIPDIPNTLLNPFYLIEIISLPEHPLAQQVNTTAEKSRIYADAIYNIDKNYFLAGNNGRISRERTTINNYPACIFTVETICGTKFFQMPANHKEIDIFIKNKYVRISLYYYVENGSTPKYMRYQTHLTILTKIAESIEIFGK